MATLVLVQTPDGNAQHGIGNLDDGEDDGEEPGNLAFSNHPVSAARHEDVEIPLPGVRLAGRLVIPEDATAVVAFVHGSGSSRHSPRNRFVAQVLHDAGIATLLFDLLTPDEERNRANVFDITLLATRLVEVTQWLRRRADVGELPLGYFGASTGAAAALLASTDPQAQPRAVVSRGGRPDLAGPALQRVTAPTLLIVGGADHQVLELNRAARRAMPGRCDLVVVPGATHLFEEPGTLEAAARLARDWFHDHLR